MSSDLSDKEKKTEKSSFTKTSKDKEYSIFLVAAPKTTVDNFLKLLNLADISPVALESETTALSRALLGEDKMNVKTSGVQRTSGVNTTKNKVIIDLGATQTSLILTEKSVPKISISLAISGNNLTDMIAKKLKITFKEAENLKKECGLDSKKCDNKLLPIVDSFIKDICKKIYEALKTYPGILENKKREPIILSGGGANMIKLDSVLSKNLKIKARKGIPDYIWNIRSKNEKFNKSQLGASTVIGLALRATLYPFPKNH